ncbi:MAG TPA: formyltetrahydrofolate deformylase [Armatimonadota bacterium]|nr:formyltetrahydrofolate deformylase [Armatimonadota bacterium]
MEEHDLNRAILLVSCPDQRGLVARLSGFIDRHGGNIITADHHVDFNSSQFLTRIEWDLERFDLARDEIAPAFRELAETISAAWSLDFADITQRVAIWVTRQDHCLLDLIWRQQAGDLRAEIPLIVSNHPELESTAYQFNIDYRYFPITAANRAEQEAAQLQVLRDYQIDLVVLAKYMQILGADLVGNLDRRAINIHHSFLPDFPGAAPYQRAFERGVKIIGATAHYVTLELDEGPIIEQDIVRVTHRDNLSDLVRKGKDLEKIVLARAVRDHLEHRVLVYGAKTVVFS